MDPSWSSMMPSNAGGWDGRADRGRRPTADQPRRVPVTAEKRRQVAGLHHLLALPLRASAYAHEARSPTGPSPRRSSPPQPRDGFFLRVTRGRRTAPAPRRHPGGLPTRPARGRGPTPDTRAWGASGGFDSLEVFFASTVANGVTLPTNLAAIVTGGALEIIFGSGSTRGLALPRSPHRPPPPPARRGGRPAHSPWPPSPHRTSPRPASPSVGGWCPAG